MRFMIQLLVILIVTACASLNSTTGYPGLKYGDSYQYTLEKLEKTHEIVEQSDSTIVIVGFWELLQQCRKIVFTFFEEDGLQQVSYQPLDESADSDSCK